MKIIRFLWIFVPLCCLMALLLFLPAQAEVNIKIIYVTEDGGGTGESAGRSYNDISGAESRIHFR